MAWGANESGVGEFEHADIGITGSTLGTALQTLLMTDNVEPGATPDYQLCKTIYLFHPLGAKMVEVPLNIAQSQKRAITVEKGPQDRIKQAFIDEWKALGADRHIFNTMRLSRVYGLASLAYGAEGVPPDRPIDPTTLYDLKLHFSVFDPLNTAGSLVLNQNPNAPDFLKYVSVAVSGVPYHRSRAVVMQNEEPVYIAFTTSTFGFTGRSVYQRALFPLKSYVQSMVTDDLVTVKAGVLVAMIKQVGSIADKVMQGLVGLKRNMLRQARTGNVLSVGHEDRIESIDMNNTHQAMTVARKNILENIAAAAAMPALLLNSETYAEGFADGTEDAKAVAQYIDMIREEMQPLYDFFDRLVMYRAWNPKFYEALQAEFPTEYGSKPYMVAFYEWKNSFKAEWPNLLTEPESEQMKGEEIKMKSVLAIFQAMVPLCDPENKGELVQWLQDNVNELKLLFKGQLDLDIAALIDYTPPMQQPGAGGEEGGEGPVAMPQPGKPEKNSLGSAKLRNDSASTDVVVSDARRLTARIRQQANAR